MKKLALIFVVVLVFVFATGCAANKFSSSTIGTSNNKEIKSDSKKVKDKENDVVAEKEKTLADRLEFVFEEICKQDKQFERNTTGTYRSCNTDELLSFATDEELSQIEYLVEELEKAIANSESLLPKDHSPATGAAKLVEDLDSILFEIWHNMLTQRQ